MNKFLVIFALVASLFAGTVKADSDVRLIYDNGNFVVAVDRYSNHGYYNGYYRPPYNYYRSYPYYGQRYYRPYGYYNYPRNYRYRYEYQYNYRFDNHRNYRHDRRHRDRWGR